MSDYILFPDGRKVDVHKVIQFLYGLNESEIRILHLLVESKEKLTAMQIAKKLKVDRTSISKPIATLVNKGLIHKERNIVSRKNENTPPRLKFLYFVNREELYGKMIKDLEAIQLEFITKYYEHLDDINKSD